MNRAFLAISLILTFSSFSFAADEKQTDLELGHYKTIAKELLDDSEVNGKKLAVAPFSYFDSRESGDGAIVAEKLTAELVKTKKLTVIERKEIEKVFQELKFQMSGAIAPSSAKSVGQVLGADWLVVGTLTELPDRHLEINARLVSVESGEIIRTASGIVKKNWLERYKRLIKEETVIIQANPKNAKAFYKRGVAYNDLMDYSKAIANFSIAITINPTFWEAYSARGDSYTANKDYDKAIEDYTKAMELTPDPEKEGGYIYKARGLAYALNKDQNKAIDDLTNLVGLIPSDENYCIRGISYYASKEYDKAILDFTKSLEINPEYAEAYRWRCATYNKTGFFKKAISDCDKAIEVRPGYASYYVGRAFVFMGNNDTDSAIKDLLKAIEISPDVNAYGNLGTIYLRQRRYSKAIEYFNKALGLAPEDAKSYTNRGYAYHANGDFALALKDFNRAIELDPRFEPQLRASIDQLYLQTR